MRSKKRFWWENLRLAFAIVTILVIGVVSIDLVFSPHTYSTGRTPPFYPDFTVKNSVCNGTGIYITLTNSLGTPVKVLNATPGFSTNNLINVTTSYDLNGTIGPNEREVCTRKAPCTAAVPPGGLIKIVMYGLCQAPGEPYSLSLPMVWYSETLSNATVYNFAGGTIAGYSS